MSNDAPDVVSRFVLKVVHGFPGQGGEVFE